MYFFFFCANIMKIKILHINFIGLSSCFAIILYYQKLSQMPLFVSRLSLHLL